MQRLVLCHLLAAIALAPPSYAASTSQQRGQAFAKAHCARCHAIGRTGESPFEPAPPFRNLHLRYPIESLGEALAEGIVTGHPAMPQFQLAPPQIHDLLSYLKSLE
ncbi:MULTISPECIES: cytochrome c [unclassified Bradyrhizobium]|uniref:c-type cytochrome n=1 Tax=unclassified Bradyrhizobium TaxID=2631580 RepID=UPI0028ECDB58|nr:MULTISPECIES: cytochrome c [unclassified Bradyrhizobium]